MNLPQTPWNKGTHCQYSKQTCSGSKISLFLNKGMKPTSDIHRDQATECEWRCRWMWTCHKSTKGLQITAWLLRHLLMLKSGGIFQHLTLTTWKMHKKLMNWIYWRRLFSCTKESNTENFLNMVFALTGGHDFKVWPFAFAEGDSSKASHDQLPVHKASIECCASVRVDVSYSFTSHLSILIHLSKYAATILDTCKACFYLTDDILLKKQDVSKLWTCRTYECWINSRGWITSILHSDCSLCTDPETPNIPLHQTPEQGHWVHHQHRSHIGCHHLHLYICPDPAEHPPQSTPPEYCKREQFSHCLICPAFLTYRKNVYHI